MLQRQRLRLGIDPVVEHDRLRRDARFAQLLVPDQVDLARVAIERVDARSRPACRPDREDDAAAVARESLRASASGKLNRIRGSDRLPSSCRSARLRRRTSSPVQHLGVHEQVGWIGLSAWQASGHDVGRPLPPPVAEQVAEEVLQCPSPNSWSATTRSSSSGMPGSGSVTASRTGHVGGPAGRPASRARPAWPGRRPRCTRRSPSRSAVVAVGHVLLVLDDRAGTLVDLVAALEVGQPLQLLQAVGLGADLKALSATT